MPAFSLKRRCVELAIAEWPKLSSNQIAEMCGVGHQLVLMAKQQTQLDDSSTSTTGKDGKQYPAKRKPQPEPQPEPEEEWPSEEDDEQEPEPESEPLFASTPSGPGCRCYSVVLQRGRMVCRRPDAPFAAKDAPRDANGAQGIGMPVFH